MRQFGDLFDSYLAAAHHPVGSPVRVDPPPTVPTHHNGHHHHHHRHHHSDDDDAKHSEHGRKDDDDHGSSHGGSSDSDGGSSHSGSSGGESDGGSSKGGSDGGSSKGRSGGGDTGATGSPPGSGPGGPTTGQGPNNGPTGPSVVPDLTAQQMEEILKAAAAIQPVIAQRAAAWNTAADTLRKALSTGGAQSFDGQMSTLAASWSGQAATSFGGRAGEVRKFAAVIADNFSSSGASGNLGQTLTALSTAMQGAVTDFGAVSGAWGSPPSAFGGLVLDVKHALDALITHPDTVDGATFGRLAYKVTANQGSPQHSTGKQITYSLTAQPLPQEKGAQYAFNGTLVHQVANPGAGQIDAVALDLIDAYGGRVTATSQAAVMPLAIQQQFTEAYRLNLKPMLQQLQDAYVAAKTTLPQHPPTAPNITLQA